MLEKIYPSSRREIDGAEIYLAVYGGVKSLVARGAGGLRDRLIGRDEGIDGDIIKVCPLNRQNADIIRQAFPFTAPICHAGKKLTIGLGDRLGAAAPGQLRLIRETGAFPVLAQQSVREITLTGRTFDDVLDAATWGVFQENYTSGFGADGDHLKTENEVRDALNRGFTMITLDCMEQIRNDAAKMPDGEISALYGQLPQSEQKYYEDKYAGKAFNVGGVEISFPPGDLKRIALVYGGAIKHTVNIYHNNILNAGRPIDFEMSIDETLSTTTPAAHFFVAGELSANNVRCVSLAPRYVGEFQKGIDYIGDIALFKADFIVHEKIAEHFGYKLSVHSGSDKFSVYPIIREATGGRYHLKTAGTHWLEALRVIAAKQPELFRGIASYALAHIKEAKKYYVTTENTANIPDINALGDGDLPELLNQGDSRQAFHISYGVILTAEKDGKRLFRDDIYKALRTYEEDYYAGLYRHLEKHLR